MVKTIQNKNSFPILNVTDPSFSQYGRIIKDIDFTEALEHLFSHTEIPDNGIYVPSEPDLEKLKVHKQVEDLIFGNIEVQAGYCNGKNSMLNALEFHKCNEVNIACDDIVLLLSLTGSKDIFTIPTSGIVGFFIPSGVAVELYQTTLHFAPCRTKDEGYRSLVYLPKGTNLPLEENLIKSDDPYSKLLFARNKWLIAHKDCKRLMDKGVHNGLIGENLKVMY